MIIGNSYSDNKIYRGIKYYDSLPLLSRDLHEYADTVFKKNAFFMNSILGSGTLNEPECSISSAGIRILSPSIVLLEGDIALIQSSSTTPLVPTTKISTLGASSGIVCIVGWYQPIYAGDHLLREYGGVDNTILPNDLIPPNMTVQVSSRFQLRWDIVVLDYNTYSSGSAFNVSIKSRDINGDIIEGSSPISLTVSASENTVKVIPKPVSMDYAVSDLYLVPILRYQYSSGTITDARAYKSLKPAGTTGFINSATEPVASDYDEGTIWYNPSTYKFKFYVPGVGFLPTASDIALMQYNNIVPIQTRYSTPSNILIDIGILEYTSSDLLQVLYNGVVLTKDTNYTVNTTTRQITLLNFTTEVGDLITFIVTKLIDTTNATSISSEFLSHVNTPGSANTNGHVKLSDTANSSQGISSNIAVTPKALYDAITLIDPITNKSYQLRVSGGVLGIEEII